MNNVFGIRTNNWKLTSMNNTNFSIMIFLQRTETSLHNKICYTHYVSKREKCSNLFLIGRLRSRKGIWVGGKFQEEESSTSTQCWIKIRNSLLISAAVALLYPPIKSLGFFLNFFFSEIVKNSSVHLIIKLYILRWEVLILRDFEWNQYATNSVI